jgi:adenylate cyclase
MSEDNRLGRIGKPPAGRKLIAVVYADMVGYSRLIELDDIGTLERLRTLRRTLIDPAIDEYGGRIVQTGGDSLLIVFDSIDGAVRYAMKVQQEVPIHDGEQSANRVICFRVGINIGDVIADGTDLHGDAVNVAARLQAECPPGGICVSRAVRDHVLGYLNLTFEELGTLNLKNIVRPVEGFVLKLGDDARTGPKAAERPLAQSRSDPSPLPDKPSIAVLAFTNMSGDRDQEYFSDGVADDIITELSRSRSLFVIARNSSFTYKSRAVDVKQVARELGVRYVLEGSVRRGGDRVRISAQLIDAEAGSHVWAERYDRKLTDVFAVQDEITNAVTIAIRPAIAHAEQQRALRKHPENLDAWEAFQHGLWHARKFNPSGNEMAKEFFRRAIALDAAFAAPYGELALAYVREGGLFATLSLAEAGELAETWAYKAVEIDPGDDSAQATMAYVAIIRGRSGEAWQRLQLALASNPNSHFGRGVKGLFLTFNARPAEGREELLVALRLNPLDPRNATYLTQIATSHYFERDYTGAVEAAKQAAARHAPYPQLYRWLAAALGQLDRLDEAREALRHAMEVSPKGFELHVHSCPPWFRQEDYEHMLDGLRKAGWLG